MRTRQEDKEQAKTAKEEQQPYACFKFFFPRSY
jgi:hypothetical protein